MKAAAWCGLALVALWTAPPAAPPATTIDTAILADALHWRGIGAATDVTHLATDTAFPYRVCASGAAGAWCASSQADPAGAGERVSAAPHVFIAPDPNDADTIFSGVVSRFDRRTQQTHDVSPLPGDPSLSAASPLMFSGADGRALFLGGTRVWLSMTAGQSWSGISPDFGAAITAIGSAVADANTLWVGLANGQLRLTRDGGRSWAAVPSPFAQTTIEAIEVSHFDGAGAYVVTRDAGGHAHAFRTRTAGASWDDIAHALPSPEPAAVREDPYRRGLLFAAASTSVAVSFDDGDTWAPLRFDLPAVAIHDLLVKDDDVVAATAGGLFVLDDITPLRQLTPDVITRAQQFLFRPATAWRVRSASRRPQGAAINYLIGPSITGPITLDIIDPTAGVGRVIRSFASAGAPAGGAEPGLSAAAGVHRFVWDLRLPPPLHDRPEVLSPFVLPGTYTLRLTINGRVLAQVVTVKIDPRVKTPSAELAAQFTQSRKVWDAMRQLDRALAMAPGDAALTAALAPLPDLLARLQDADVRPTAAVESLVEHALTAATQALARRGER